ncbi:per [Trypoxylus dichotomus]
MLNLLTFCTIASVQLLTSVGDVNGAVPILRGPICGSLTCEAYEYCNQFAHACDKCESICNPENHNFEDGKCRQQCEVYIYDQRYFRADDGTGNLKDTINKLQVNYVVILALLIIVILVLAAVSSIFAWKWKKNNNVTWATFHKKISRKDPENNTNGVSPAKPTPNDQNAKKPDLHLEITPSSAQSEPTPVTMTTGVTTRIPAEDSIEYAYDNPAMSNSLKKPGSTAS